MSRSWRRSSGIGRSATLRVLACTAAVALGTSGLAAAEGVASLDARPLAQALILFGSFFLLAAGVGVFRFPDSYIRLHAATKLVTLGGVGIFGAAALVFAEVQAAERLLLIIVFFFLTAPLSGYMIARSAYLRGLPPVREEGSVDEWGACGVAAEAEGAAGTEVGGGSEARQLPSSRDGADATR